MKNEYEIRGEITAIIINSPKYGRHEALISTSKLERAKEFPNSWGVMWCETTRSFYVQGHLPRMKVKRKTVRLHRWITQSAVGMQVDHRDHDTLNNTDKNLRVVTRAENMQNYKGAYVNSKSGIRGVSWCKVKKMWHATMSVNKKNKHIGYFDDIDEADHAAVQARMRHMPYSQETIL